MLLVSYHLTNHPGRIEVQEVLSSGSTEDQGIQKHIYFILTIIQAVHEKVLVYHFSSSHSGSAYI